MQKIPQTPEGIVTVSVLLTVATVLFILSALSLKKGKTIKTKVALGESGYVLRQDDPVSFWYSFSVILGVGVFSASIAVWILIYGYR